MSNCCSGGGLSLWAGVMHGLQAIVVFALIATLNAQNKSGFEKGVFPLTKTVVVWEKGAGHANSTNEASSGMIANVTLTRLLEPSGEIDARFCIASFFALSCLFQIAAVSLSMPLGPLTGALLSARLRLCEYSISASVMVLCIAVECGISDLYTLEQMFLLMFCTMFLGMAAEVVSTLSESGGSGGSEPLYMVFGHWAWIPFHAASWGACFAAYGPILDTFMNSQSKSSTKAPGFVNAIVGVQCALFMCFGLVQTWLLTCRSLALSGEQLSDGCLSCCFCCGTKTNDEEAQHSLMAEGRGTVLEPPILLIVALRAERAYVILSFTAKTLLAWLILAPLL